jgi:hypothetical protein
LFILKIDLALSHFSRSSLQVSDDETLTGTLSVDLCHPVVSSSSSTRLVEDQ